MQKEYIGRKFGWDIPKAVVGLKGGWPYSHTETVKKTTCEDNWTMQPAEQGAQYSLLVSEIVTMHFGNKTAFYYIYFYII